MSNLKEAESTQLEHTQKPSILIVDDDKKIRELLSQFLDANNFKVSAAQNAAEARSYIARQTFDLLIVDVMMPGESGTEFTNSLRNNNKVPIILLTARDQLQDKIKGFDSGADDYLTKPFEPSELIARIKALLRRSNNNDEQKPIAKFGGYIFHLDTGLLFLETANGTEQVHLTTTETIFLKTLSQNPGQPFSRKDLAQRIGHMVSERTVDVQITRLRKKIGDDPRHPTIIQTVRHMGYSIFVE